MKIKLYHINHAYDKEAPVLDDVNLTLEAGDFLWLTGPSGAGKSTLFKLIFGLLPPTAGQITVEDQLIYQMNHKALSQYRQKIGMIFQDLKLLNHRNVFENVALPLEALGVSMKEQKRKVFECLYHLEIGHYAYESIQNLSGGEKQRVAIARALVNHPELILADEPTGSLDQSLSLDVIRLLKAHSSKGAIVLISTHELGLIPQFTGRHLMLNKGKIKEVQGFKKWD
jgi:cell division transport system ATP-binding protein